MTHTAATHAHARERSRLERLADDPAGPLRDVERALRDALDVLVGVAPIAAAAIVAAGVLVWAWRAHARRHRQAGAQWVEIALPPTVDPAGGRLMWGALHDLLAPTGLLAMRPSTSWELSGTGERTRFALWLTPDAPAAHVQRAISAAWPGATATLLPQHAPRQHASRQRARGWAVTELRLSGPEWLTLRTTTDDGPLRLLIGQLSALDAGERAVVQVVARPARRRAHARLRAHARRLRHPTPVRGVADLLDIPPRTRQRATTVDPQAAQDVRGVLAKAAQPLFDVAIRVAVQAPDRARRRAHLRALSAAFTGFEGRVGLRRHHARGARRALADRRVGRRESLLSLDELAALATLPSTIGLPGLTHAAARRVPPPPDLPTAGKPLGHADAGEPRPVAIAPADARQHLHVMGATGAGKSTLIAQLVLADAAADRGAVVIDPKGDLVDAILARLPNPPKDLVVIDPERNTRPVGLNVLEGHDPQLVTDHVTATFRHLYSQFWGPRTDDVLRATLLTLAQRPGLTLAEIPVCLTDPDWRRRLTADLPRHDSVLAGFWRSYDHQSDAAQAQITAPLLNKLRAFLLRREVRNVIGQPKTTFSLPSVLDRGGLLLARLPKGTLGEDTSRLLGALLVTRTWQHALARSRQPEPMRRDCGLYVDEVHNYLALPSSFEDLLAEARGYRLSLCLAHQHLGQLPKPLADALSANARTKVTFACSPEDARALERHYAPDLAAHDLSSLERHHAACRTLANGNHARPFTLATTPLPDGDDKHAARLRHDSEQRYGRNPREVEQRMRARQLQPAGSPDR